MREEIMFLVVRPKLERLAEVISKCETQHGFFVLGATVLACSEHNNIGV